SRQLTRPAARGRLHVRGGTATVEARLPFLSPMHIRDWPAGERPREKLLARGPGSLADAELLALFLGSRLRGRDAVTPARELLALSLGSGRRGRDAVTTARELLATRGPLRALLDRPPPELARLPGLGPARACTLAAALGLGHRHLEAQLERGATLSDPRAAG